MLYKTLLLKISQKTPVLESLFNTAETWRPATLLKKRLPLRCFLMNIAKFCKVTYFEEHMPAPAFAFCQKLHYQIILNLQKQLSEGVPQKSYFWKLCKIHRKTPVWVSTLKKIQSVGLTAWRVSKYRVISGPYFAVFGLNTEIYFVNLRNQSGCRKIRTLFRQCLQLY